MKQKVLIVLCLLVGIGVACNSSNNGGTGSIPMQLGGKCASNTDCLSALVCSATSKTCQLQSVNLCRDSAICAGLGICSATTQTCGCGTKPDCSLANTSCTGGQCYCGSNPPTTTGNTCTSGQWTCGTGPACLATSTCNASGKCTCNVDTDCASGKTCQSGICHKQTALSCRDNTACNGLGTCQSGKGSGTMQPSGNACYCGSSPDCTLPNTTCTSNQCYCGTNAPTPAGNTCTADHQWKCGTNALCSGASDTCTSGSCGCGNSGVPCGFGETCSNGKCTGNRHVFLTQNQYTPGTTYTVGSKTFANQSDANKICNAEAVSQGFGGMWAAVLGDNTNTAYANLVSANGGAFDSTRNVVTPTGLPISGGIYTAATHNSFSDIANWIQQTAYWTRSGQFSQFWVSVDSDIYDLGYSGNICVGWSSNASSDSGNVAKASAGWHVASMTCNIPQYLLCIELDQ